MRNFGKTLIIDHRDISTKVIGNTTKTSAAYSNASCLRTQQRTWRLFYITVSILIALAVSIPTIFIFKKNSNTDMPTESIRRTTTAVIKTTTTTTARTGSTSKFNITAHTKWSRYGITIAGKKGIGSELDQLNFPENVYVDDDDDLTIYIADNWNDRILKWKSGAQIGQVVAGGERGNETYQLNGPTAVIFDQTKEFLIICDQENQRIMRWPRQNSTNGEIIISNINCYGLAIDDGGYLYIADPVEHVVTKWKIGDTSGIVVAGGHGQGNDDNQLDYPTYLFVDHEYSVYVSDQNNYRVMKWMQGAREGVVVAGGQGKGKNLTQLGFPMGVVADHLGHVYVVDRDYDRVTRWLNGDTQGSIIIGANVSGLKPHQLYGPRGLFLDKEGSMYLTDTANYRIQKFLIESY